MQRYEVNQAFLDLREAPAYLEIGVQEGTTFGHVRAARKVAVDPVFAFEWHDAAADPANAHCSYQQVTSDTYFGSLRGGETFDLIFIDGLHTYEQTLRDLLNAILCLKPGGLIVVDDMMPCSYAASLGDIDLTRRFWAATGNPDDSWMGDVFRLAFFIETFLQGYSYALVVENCNQMVLWQEPRAQVVERTVEATARLHYVDAVLNVPTFHLLPFAQILENVREWQARIAG